MSVTRRGRVNSNQMPGVLLEEIDTGPGLDVPVGAGVSVTTSPVAMQGAHFVNTAIAPNTITVTDTAGKILVQNELPAGAVDPYIWNDRPANGVKWSATIAGMKGHIW